MNKNTSVIQLKDVSYNVDDNLIVSKLNIQLVPGKFVGIIGPNGAGKSTLLKLITNIIKPSTGNIYLNDINISSYNPKELNRKIAYLQQNISYNFPFKVLEVVLMGRYPYLSRMQNENSNDISISTKSLELVDMEKLKLRNILSLSGGEQQRVSIARILAQKTDFIFLDEPISNLDINHQLSIMKLLNSLSKENKGIYAVLHDIRLAYNYCDKVIVMDKGKLIAEGTPSEVLTQKLISSVFKVSSYISNDNNGKSRIELIQ